MRCSSEWDACGVTVAVWECEASARSKTAPKMKTPMRMSILLEANRAGRSGSTRKSPPSGVVELAKACPERAKRVERALGGVSLCLKAESRRNYSCRSRAERKSGSLTECQFRRCLLHQCR